MNINRYISDIENKHNIRVVYLTKSGSTLYGTNGPDSDVDYKGIFIPATNDILLKQDKPYVSFSTGSSTGKNSADDIDIHLDSISTFVRLLAKGETGALDLLFSMYDDSTSVIDDSTAGTWICNAIMDNRARFYGSNLHAFIGYAIGQTKKYNIKGARYNELVKLNQHLGFISNANQTIVNIKPTIEDVIRSENLKYIRYVMADGPRSAKSDFQIEYLEVLGKKYMPNISVEFLKSKLKSMEDQFGNRARNAVEDVDFKSLSHAARVIYEVEELLKSDFIKFPLTYADEIKDIKSGNRTLESVMTIIEHKLPIIDKLMEDPTRRASSDKEFTDKFLLDLYSGKFD
jgi:hypothetical protein